MKIFHPHLCSLAVLSVLGSVSAISAQAQILGYDINFNSGSTTYTDNFRGASDAAAAGFTWGASSGTGGSGGLTVTNTGANNIFYRPAPPDNATSTFDFTSMAAGTTIVTTTDFVWSNIAATDSTLLTAGFVPNNSTVNALTSSGALAGSLIRNAGTSTVTLRMRNGTTNAATINFSQATLTAGNWYQLSYEITKSATANTFDYTVSLYSLGATGTGTPVLFNDGTNDITLSGTLTNSAIYGDANAFFAYDIRDTVGDTGITRVDNFSVEVVPEPMSASLVAAGLLSLAAFRRHRR